MKTTLRLLPGSLALLGALLVAAPAPAQELDILELDDFIDPRDLAVAATAGHAPRFFASRLYLGTGDNYQFRANRTPRRVDFAHVVGAYYVSNWQANLKLTGLDTNGYDSIPYVRARAQLARYFVGDGRNDVVRTQLSWTVDDRESDSPRHEVALDVDFSLNIHGLHHGFTGGAVYARDLSEGMHYLGLATRLPVVRWRSGSAIRIGAGLAQYRDEISRVLDRPNIRKMELSWEIVLPRLESRLHAAYTPAYLPDRGGWNHEVALLLNAPLVARLF